MAETSGSAVVDSNVSLNEAIYRDIGQGDHGSIREVTMIGEVIGSFTPLHLTSDVPEKWCPKLSVCAVSAAKRGEETATRRSMPRCSLALTSFAPRRRGRACTPVAPAARVPRAAMGTDDGIMVTDIDLISSYSTGVTTKLGITPIDAKSADSNSLHMMNVSLLDVSAGTARLTIAGKKVTNVPTATVGAEAPPEETVGVTMATLSAQRQRIAGS